MTDELNSKHPNPYSNKGRPPNQAKMKNRMDFIPRNFQGVCNIVSNWGGEKIGVKSPKYWEYSQLWKWLEVRAEKEEKNIWELPCTPGGVRMSVEYIRRVHEDEMEDHTPKSLRDTCHTFLDDYLLWFESDLAEFIFRCEQLVETQRIKSLYHVARKKIKEGINSDKNTKYLDMYVKMIGRDKAVAEEKEGNKIEIVDEYLDGERVKKKNVVMFKGPPKVDNSNRADHGHENRGKDSIPKDLSLSEVVEYVEGKGS